MGRNCLYCCEPVDGAFDFHRKCSVVFFGTPVPPALPYTIDQMEEMAKNVVERSVAVPGVQPKLSMSLIREAWENSDHRLTVVGALGGNYILKPPSTTYPDLPENEHATMRMAEACGIRVVPSTLIRLRSGELAYLTKRIDRNERGEKIHMIDLFQITEAFDKYRGSMEKIGKALDECSAHALLDKTFFFDLALFSFLTGNSDMHLKNFSMIERASGWVLSPAYDLLNVALVFPEDTEELALSMGGKKRKLRRTDFEAFGESLGLTAKQTSLAFRRMARNQPVAFDRIDRSFLSAPMKTAYKQIMEHRYQQIGLNQPTP